MSSTATTSINPSSSRVQSASKTTTEETPIENNNATAEKISRPPSASPKPISDITVSAATDDGIVSDLAGGDTEEPVLSTVTCSSERAPSANKQVAMDSGNSSRPASAANADATANVISEPTNTETATSRPSSVDPKLDNSASHGYSIDTTPRPPSASLIQNQRATTGSRPTSAISKVNESSEQNSSAASNSRPPSAQPQTSKVNNSRPPSANQNPNPTTKTGSRPPSAGQNTNEVSTTGSRPSSSSLRKTDDSILNNSNVATTGSRPVSASQPTDIAKTSDTNDGNVPASSRLSSAAKKPDATTGIGSRPSSASQKAVPAPAAATTSEQQNDCALFTTDDVNAAQPAIGRPASATKQTPTDESKILVSVDHNTSASNSREDLTSDESKPVEANTTTPRIGSASKKN